jgi:phenylacetate-CoA ligase
MSDRYWDERAESLPDADRRLVTDHRLHWQLRRSLDASPFYRERLEAAGLDPLTFGGSSDFAAIPTLRPEDLVKECEEAPPFGRLTVAPTHWWEDADPRHPLPRRIRTDGDVSHAAGLAARALWAAGARPKHRMVLDGAGPDDPVGRAIMGGGERIRRLAAASNRDGEPFRVRVGGGDAEAAVVWLLGGPYEATSAGQPPVAYGLPLVGPTLAYECSERRGLHWADDHWLLEIVDPATLRPRRPGRSGALLLTDLTREGSPLLRFWTTLATALETGRCACGRTSPRSTTVRPL